MNGQTLSQFAKRLRLTAISLLICWLTLGTSVAQSRLPPSPSRSIKPVPGSDAPILTPGNIDTKNYPVTVVNFSIEKQDKTLFRQLEYTDVEAQLDNQKIGVGADALSKTAENEPLRILFMIDRSGSMQVGKKIGAAQDALRHFISQLNPYDEVAISTFGNDADDDGQVLSFTKVENSSLINSAIDGIQARDKRTALYDGVQEATRQAERGKAGIIIFLSDGKEDTDGFNQLTTSEQSDEKRRRETNLGNSLNQKGIRFFAVAIGDPDANNQGYVDQLTLENISKLSSGETKLVNMTEINREADGNSETSRNMIAGLLKTSLAEIKKSFKFAYALRLNLPRSSMKERGELKLIFNVGDGNKKWVLDTTYPYTMGSNGIPVFGKPEVGVPVFIATVTTLNLDSLSLIYLLLLAPLLLFAAVPRVINRISTYSDLRKVNQAITTIRRGSNLIGTQCPNESGNWGKRFAFRENDTIIVCPNCSTPHHLICWEENKFQCMSRVCGNRYEIPANILVKYNTQNMR
jgi:Mg-chelatase subunit ChlD/Zn ribbon nucleic-acid-binding protein